MKRALFWTARKDATGASEAICELCPRRCVLHEGQTGACGVRQVRDGKLFAMTYGKPCALHVDPVEKKPLFHFYPGERIFSLATIGCNLFCDFCQNWQISTAKLEELDDDEEMTPKEIIRLAKEAGCRLIAFTYTEPTVFYEYMLDIAKLAKKAKMECAIVSNGYIEEAPLRQLIPFISAANIDLKGSKEFYRKRCKVPDYDPIRRTIATLKAAGVHVEVTTLIIPGENDADGEVERRARWIAENVGKTTPLHLSAFRGEHKMRETPSTCAETLLTARDLSRKHLDFVYLGNVHGADNDTRCPGCGAVVIARPRYAGHPTLTNGRCPACSRELPGRFA